MQVLGMTPVSATITRALAHTQPIQGTHNGYVLRLVRLAADRLVSQVRYKISKSQPPIYTISSFTCVVPHTLHSALLTTC